MNYIKKATFRGVDKKPMHVMLCGENENVLRTLSSWTYGEWVRSGYASIIEEEYSVANVTNIEKRSRYNRYTTSMKKLLVAYPELTEYVYDIITALAEGVFTEAYITLRDYPIKYVTIKDREWRLDIVATKRQEYTLSVDNTIALSLAYKKKMGITTVDVSFQLPCGLNLELLFTQDGEGIIEVKPLYKFSPMFIRNADDTVTLHIPEWAVGVSETFAAEVATYRDRCNNPISISNVVIDLRKHDIFEFDAPILIAHEALKTVCITKSSESNTEINYSENVKRVGLFPGCNNIEKATYSSMPVLYELVYGGQRAGI